MVGGRTFHLHHIIYVYGTHNYTSNIPILDLHTHFIMCMKIGVMGRGCCTRVDTPPGPTTATGSALFLVGSVQL